MDSRRTYWIGVALAVVIAIGVPLASAQTPPGAATGEPYTPAKDAKDLKAVLFNWFWHQGMLKGHDERDMVGTLEYQGKGTIQVDGQPCTLTKFRASTNYQSFTQRVQYTCTRAGGQKASNVEVVSEISDLIAAQRAYEMNAKVISATDQMLQSTAGMFR